MRVHVGSFLRSLDSPVHSLVTTRKVAAHVPCDARPLLPSPCNTRVCTSRWYTETKELAREHPLVLAGPNIMLFVGRLVVAVHGWFVCASVGAVIFIVRGDIWPIYIYICCFLRVTPRNQKEEQLRVHCGASNNRSNNNTTTPYKGSCSPTFSQITAKSSEST